MGIEKRENAIKDAYWRRFEQLYTSQQYFILQHQDVRTSGHPDNSLNGYGHSTWWEFKHATPNFSTYGLQELTCLRLAKHSYCRYILFYEYRDARKIIVAHPRAVHQRDGKTSCIASEIEFDGHDFDKLAGFMHAVHTPQVVIHEAL